MAKIFGVVLLFSIVKFLSPSNIISDSNTVCGPVEHSWPGAPYCCNFSQASRKFEVSWYGFVVLRFSLVTGVGLHGQ